MWEYSFCFLAVVICVLLPAGCASSPEALETEADFTGWVMEIQPVGNGEVLGQILVEAQADKYVDKCMVTIKDETLIFR